jgi:hypothetical protein
VALAAEVPRIAAGTLREIDGLISQASLARVRFRMPALLGMLLHRLLQCGRSLHPVRIDLALDDVAMMGQAVAPNLDYDKSTA